MSSEREIRILLYSLELVGNFVDNVQSINSSDEFMQIQNRNIQTLKQLSKERGTEYFIEKIKEYPSFSESEIDEYIKQRSKDKSFLSVFGGHLFAMFEWVYKTAKTKGNNMGKTREHLLELKRINQSIVYVVQNPGFDELIKAEKKL